MLPNALLDICTSLVTDVNKKVGPGKCRFEPTKKFTGHHFSVHGGKPRVIAWVVFRIRGIRTDNPKRPCVVVGIRGDLLNEHGAVASGLAWKPNANFVSERAGGYGEWHGVTYTVGDIGYKAILYGLQASTMESAKRASCVIGRLSTS